MLESLEAGIYRLDEAGLIETHAVRDFFYAALDDPVHDADVLRKAAAGRLESRRHADLLVDRALRKQLAPAIEAFAARNVVKHHHPVAGMKARDAGAHRRDHAGGFVAVNPGRLQQVIGDLLQIRVADAARLHADQDLPRTNLRDGNRFHFHASGAAIHRGLHCPLPRHSTSGSVSTGLPATLIFAVGKKLS